MLDMTTLTQFINPVILVACLVVGYIIKNWISGADNKIIPTVVCLLGILIAMVIALTNPEETLSVNTIVTGAISGLASTGLHQVFKTWLETFGNNS